jgi:hypothetical protein
MLGTTEPLYAGWLHKRGHRRKNWKRRFFVVEVIANRASRKRLVYYASEDTIPPNRLGQYDILSVESWPGKEHGIVVHTLSGKSGALS